MTAMGKLLEMFKNLKSDAMPRPPRPIVNDPPPQDQNVNPNVSEDTEEHEEIIIEPNDDAKDKKKGKKQKKTFFKSKQVDDYDDFETIGNDNDTTTSSVHVQATGNVYNIVNSKDVRLGNDYFFGPVTMPKRQNKGKMYEEEEEIVKDNLITLLMEANMKPDHDFMDYITKNLGKNWQCVFRALGFSQANIETAIINAGSYGVCEARYQLLREWVNNDDDGSIGRLTKLLWEEGERSIVKQLSAMYKKMKK